MSNAYKRHPDRGQLQELLGAAGIGRHEVSEYEPLVDGAFNTAYRVRRTDGTGLVLKISPEPSAPILRYEQRIMRTEALFYDLARRCDAPVPTVVYAGFDHDVIDGDFLLMSECPGQPWHGWWRASVDRGDRAERRVQHGVRARRTRERPAAPHPPGGSHRPGGHCGTDGGKVEAAPCRYH